MAARAGASNRCIRCAAARDELARAHRFSLNSSQLEGYIQVSKASILNFDGEIYQNNHDSYTSKRRTAYTRRSYPSLSFLSLN
jgi:hypothetical protein